MSTVRMKPPASQPTPRCRRRQPHQQQQQQVMVSTSFLDGNDTGGGDTTATLKSQPIGFHHIHAENIQVSLDKKRAKRYESFCKGICFSNRPIPVGERVYLRFAEISTSWSGVLRFGFTSNDPCDVNPATLPRYACPDLTNKPGYWAKALGERYAEVGNIIFFYVTRNGDVMYGANGEEKGLFFSGVVTTGPLWAVMDIYGNTMSMEFVDGRQMNNLTQTTIRTNQEVSNITSGMSNVSISPPHLQNQRPRPTQDAPNLPLRYHTNATFAPLQFHEVHGRNVHISPERTIAVRAVDEYCNGYVFTSRPLRCGEKMIIQILSVDRAYVGGMAVGLTSCDPVHSNPDTLPDDSDLLLDRSEYWVVNKDVCRSPDVGDELSFFLTEDGEVQYGKNGHHVATLMHVDKTLPLWAFFDVYGNTQKIKLVGVTLPALAAAQAHSPPVAPPPRQAPSPVVSPPQSQQPPPVPQRGNSARPAPNFNSLTVALPPPLQPQVLHAGGASSPMLPVLRPQLPPSRSNSSPAVNLHMTHTQRISPSLPTKQPQLPRRLSNPAPPSIPASSMSLPGPEADYDRDECTICYEKQVDCVLYTCGHMCVCYECALAVKQHKEGICPICRKEIRDIIKIYRS